MILSRVPIKNTHLTVASRTVSIAVNVIPINTKTGLPYGRLKIIYVDQDNLIVEFGDGKGFNKFTIGKNRCYCGYQKNIYPNIIGDWKMVNNEGSIMKFCRMV